MIRLPSILVAINAPMVSRWSMMARAPIPVTATVVSAAVINPILIYESPLLPRLNDSSMVSACRSSHCGL